MSHSAPKYAFGPFQLDVGEQQFLRDRQSVPLTAKAFELLSVLVEQSGHLLEKQELLQRVWKDAFVEEAVLSVNIAVIRRALGDEGRHYIETVPKRGYRFIAPVQRIESAGGRPDDVAARAESALVSGDAPASLAGVNPAPTDVSAAPPGIAAAVADVPAGAGGRRWRWMALASVLTLVGLLLMAVAGWRALAPVPLGNSVAVLPLQSLSDDAEQQHFADAMTDLLLTNLGRIPQLRVVSRQSVLQYRRTKKTIPQIARELNVDCIVEGTVRREGDRVRITAQLIQGPTDRHLWAQRYERDLGDAMGLQEEVAESIAREIGVKLVAPSRAHEAPHVSRAAYEAYLRGLALLDSGDSEKAIVEFRKAVAADPKYTPAYTKIAATYFDLGYFSAMPPREAFTNVKEAALDALEIDDRDAEAHADLAMAKLHYDWDWQGADREFRRSLELNPSDADVRHLYAHYLLTVGRWSESMTEMDRAFETDPVGLFTAT